MTTRAQHPNIHSLLFCHVCGPFSPSCLCSFSPKAVTDNHSLWTQDHPILPHFFALLLTCICSGPAVLFTECDNECFLPDWVHANCSYSAIPCYSLLEQWALFIWYFGGSSFSFSNITSKNFMKKIGNRLHQITSKSSFQHILKTAKETDEKQKALGIWTKALGTLTKTRKWDMSVLVNFQGLFCLSNPQFESFWAVLWILHLNWK